MVESPACHCGFKQETAEQFLCYCPLWDEERLILNNIIQHLILVTADNLLFVCGDVHLEVNKVVFQAVHSFMKTNKRFA